MSRRFSDIFAQELKAAGLEALAPCPEQPASCESDEATCPPLPAMPAVRLGLSDEAVRYSSSLQHYSQEKGRLNKTDSGILTGQRQSGYLWKSQDGISGEMSFSTQSGSRVTIAASGTGASASSDLRISVEKDGHTYNLALEEIAHAATLTYAPPLLALEGGSQSTEDMRSASSGTCTGVTYSPRGIALRHTTGHAACARV